MLELARAVVLADVPGLTLEVHGPRPSYHGDLSYVQALETLAAEDPRIRLHGPYPLHQRAEVLATLDAVAVPSLWEESFGLSAREARAASLPVLASRIGGLRQLEGDPGVQFLDPRNPGRWADAIRSLSFGPVTGPQPGGSEAERHAFWIARTLATLGSLAVR